MFKKFQSLFFSYFATPTWVNIALIVLASIALSLFGIFVVPKQANTIVVLLPGILALFVAWRAYLVSAFVMFFTYAPLMHVLEPDVNTAWSATWWIVLIGVFSYEVIYRLASYQRQKDSYYRALVQNANDLTCIIDQKGLLRYMSPSFYHVLGYTDAELLGKNAFAIMYKEDRPVVQQRFAESLYNENETGRPIEFRLIHKNGHILHFTGMGVKKPNEPLIRGMIINAYDITARKKAEKAFAIEHEFVKSVINATAQPLCVSNVEGTIYYYVNEAYCQLVEHTQQEIMGQNNLKLSAILHPDDVEKVMRYRQQAIAGQEVKPYHSRLIMKSGQQKDVLVSYGLVKDVSSSNKLIVTLTDLTASKQTEAALKLARDKAEEASKLKSQFLATVSHELRTPMNAILGYTELLLDTELDETQRDFARTAYEAGESLLDIINEILDFARIEAGKFVLDYYEFDVTDVCQRTIEMLRPRAISKNLALEMAIAPDVPHILWGDGKRLRQILVNLINNAIKFTPRGKVKLTVRMADVHRISTDYPNHRLTFDKHELYFEIEDTGLGISDTIKARLFQPFSQGDSSHTRPHGGTGLGLSICKGLVEMMGGTIGLYSQEGQGSIFWFTAQFASANLNEVCDSRVAQQYHPKIEESNNDSIARTNIAVSVS